MAEGEGAETSRQAPAAGARQGNVLAPELLMLQPAVPTAFAVGDVKAATRR